MHCIACGSEAVTERLERIKQGDRRFRCGICGKQLNERSGSLLNQTQYPSDVIALVMLWRLRYKLSLRDLLATPGSHEVRERRSPADRRQSSEEAGRRAPSSWAGSALA